MYRIYTGKRQFMANDPNSKLPVYAYTLVQSSEIMPIDSCQKLQAFVRTVPVSTVFVFYVHNCKGTCLFELEIFLVDFYCECNRLSLSVFLFFTIDHT